MEKSSPLRVGDTTEHLEPNGERPVQTGQNGSVNASSPRDVADHKSCESPQELAARLKREGVEFWSRWIKDLILYFAALAGTGTIIVICYQIITNSASAPDDKKWATAIFA